MLDKLCMSHHRRIHRRKKLYRPGIILAHHAHYRRAGGRYEILIFTAFKKLIVFGSDAVCSHGGFLRLGKTEQLQSRAHYAEIVRRKAGNKRRSQRGDNLSVGRKQLFNRFQAAVNALGVLRANVDAMTAENTAIVDNARLSRLHSYGLNGTVAQAPVAVFAIGLIKIQIFCHIDKFPRKTRTARKKPTALCQNNAFTESMYCFIY